MVVPRRNHVADYSKLQSKSAMLSNAENARTPIRHYSATPTKVSSFTPAKATGVLIGLATAIGSAVVKFPLKVCVG